MFVASNKDGDVLRDDFDQYLYPRGDTISCSEGKKKGERMEIGGGKKKARKKEEEREFGMRARRRAIREELSLFSHQNDDFFFSPIF